MGMSRILKSLSFDFTGQREREVMYETDDVIVLSKLCDGNTGFVYGRFNVWVSLIEVLVIWLEFLSVCSSRDQEPSFFDTRRTLVH